MRIAHKPQTIKNPASRPRLTGFVVSLNLLEKSNMNSLALNTNLVKTMSSRQIADVVDKRHDNVKRTIETLAKQGVIQLPQIEEVKNHLGQAVQEHMVSERDSYIVVAQLCPEYTAKLVDYWMATKNQQPVIKATKKPSELSSTFRSCMSIAKLCGLKGNQAVLSADRATRKLTGESPLELLEITHLHAPVQEVSLTPTQIGELLKTPLSARKVNILLEGIGYQVKTGDQWLPTEKGKSFSEVLDAGKKHSYGTPVKQLKWYHSIVACLDMEKAA